MKRRPPHAHDRAPIDETRSSGSGRDPFPMDEGLMRDAVQELLQNFPDVAPSVLKKVLLLAEHSKCHNPAISSLDVLANIIVKKKWPCPADSDHVILEAIDLVRELPNELETMGLVLHLFEHSSPHRPTGQSVEVQR